MSMDEETRARLKAGRQPEGPPAVIAGQMDPETARRLKERFAKREQHLAETGGVGGGLQRAGAAAMNALITEPAMAAAQLTGQADKAAIDRMRAEGDYLRSTPQGQFGHIVGSALPSALVGGAVGQGLKGINAMRNMNVTRNALGGAAGGAAMPVGEQDSRGANMVVGGVMSALPSAVKKFITQPIRPTAEAQKLIDQGIYPTPGQAKGGMFNSLESSATSIPGFGNFVSTARAKPFAEYVARRQKHFGYEGDKTGRLATEEMAKISDENYDKVLPKLQLEVTPELRAQYLRNTTGLKRPGVQDVNQMIELQLDPMVAKSPANIIGGEDLNSWQSMLRERGAKLSQSPDVFQQDIGKAYGNMRRDTINAIENQGLVAPEAAQEFADARNYYKGFKELGDLTTSGAAAKRGGMFTPAEDLKWMEKNYGKDTFIRNQAPDQDLAQTAKGVLGEVPDSGTAGRLAMLSFLKDPNLSVSEGLVGGGLAAMSPQYARRMVVGDTAWQKALANGLRRSGFDNPWVTSAESSLVNASNQD